jgi:hypothetical protein
VSRRSPKKSETLEVRIPHEVKDALMRKAQAEGRSASEVVRSFIESYLAGKPKEARSMLMTLWKPAAAIGALSISLIGVALIPSASNAQPDLKSVFHLLDRNHDGVITMAEFVRDASDPQVQQMHHAHMKDLVAARQMGSAHAQLMEKAHAQPSDQMLRAHFSELDANSDGSVTFQEFQSFHDKMKTAHSAH